MSYKNHKDQKLLAEAYKSINNKQLLNEIDASEVVAGSVGRSASMAWKGGKALYNKMAGTKEQRAYQTKILNNLNARFPNKVNTKLSDLVKYLVDAGFATPFVYKLYNYIKTKPNVTLAEYGNELGGGVFTTTSHTFNGITKTIAKENEQNLSLTPEEIKDLRKYFRSPTPPGPTPPGPSPTPPGPTPPDHPEYDHDY